MPLDFSHCGCEHLFRDALREGINLFCGAGFSVEARDVSGNKLPLGAELLEELKAEFPREELPLLEKLNDLPRASDYLLRTDKQSFNDFLKSRFTVASYDPSYDALHLANIKKIYTTNIDDLVFKIFDSQQSKKYLNDCSEKGAIHGDSNAVGYYPLHGCVRNKSDYVFGAIELASAFSRRGSEQSWRDLGRDASSSPILFWGWNFADFGPLRAMYGNGGHADDNQLKWALLRNPDDALFATCEVLQFNIIIGDTQAMLSYIKDVMADSTVSACASSNEYAPDLADWEPPKKNSELPSFPLKSMFLEYLPRWSHIYSGILPKTSNYKKVADSIASQNDTVVHGMRCSGKTTIMMQLLADYPCRRPKHFFTSPTLEQVNFYLSRLGNRQSLVFVDDCFRDTDAVIALFKADNVQVICFCRDFNYELQYFKIEPFKFNSIDVTEITVEDAQAIINVIPEEIKYARARTRGITKDPTMVSLLAKTLRTGSFTFMDSFSDEDYDAARVFLMIAYVQSCGIPCSFDMVYSFLGDEQYTHEEMHDIIIRAGGLIKDAINSDSYDITMGLQDYYQCSSRFLAERIIENTSKDSSLLSDVLDDFVDYVPIFKICNYDLFKRSGYDADFAVRAFPRFEDGERFYSVAESKDDSEYLYQQAAIYCLRLHRYKEAFSWIERAKNLTHINRFSIQSTYARIYFEVNIDSDQRLAEEALNQIADCCANDKRKWIHFINYAECCLRYFNRYHDPKHLSSALHYVNEGLDEKTKSLGTMNKKRLINLRRRLEKCVAKAN